MKLLDELLVQGQFEHDIFTGGQSVENVVRILQRDTGRHQETDHIDRASNFPGGQDRLTVLESGSAAGVCPCLFRLS